MKKKVATAIYKLEPALNVFRHIGCERSVDRLRVIQLPMSKVATGWKPLRVNWIPETAGRIVSDYPNFSIKLDAYSKRAVSALMPFLIENGELLKLTGLRGHYMGYHLLNVSNALHLRRSEVDYDRTDGIIGYIWKATFRRTMLEPFSMFRVKGNFSHVFVTQDFVEAVKRADLTGFSFERCDVK